MSNEKDDPMKELAKKIIDEMTRQMNEDAGERIKLRGMTEDEKNTYFNEKIELKKRELILRKKWAKRALKEFLAMIGLLAGMLSILTLWILSIITTYMNLAKLEKMDDWVSIVQFVTLDPYYITWLIPITILITSLIILYKSNPNDTKSMFKEVRERMF